MAKPRAATAKLCQAMKEAPGNQAIERNLQQVLVAWGLREPPWSAASNPPTRASAARWVHFPERATPMVLYAEQDVHRITQTPVGRCFFAARSAALECGVERRLR